MIPSPPRLTPEQRAFLQSAVCTCGEQWRIGAERRGFMVVLICRACARVWPMKGPQS